jgi:hypothetical protein
MLYAAKSAFPFLLGIGYMFGGRSITPDASSSQDGERIFPLRNSKLRSRQNDECSSLRIYCYG